MIEGKDVYGVDVDGEGGRRVEDLEIIYRTPRQKHIC